MADEVQPAVEETTPETPVAAEEPKKHHHSETILKVCDELEIGRESAELLDGPQLRTEIEDAQRLLQVRQAKRGYQAPIASQTAPAPVVAPEEEVKLTAEEEAELENTPAIKKAVLEGKRAAARTAKLERELEAVKSRSSGNDAEQEVKRLLADVPTPAGVSKEDRDTVVMRMIAAHHQLGHFQNVPFAEAVILMQKKYAPAASAKAPVPTPTRIHAPTNRLNQAEQDRLAAAAASNSAANNGFGEP